jgi:hypothetical protein
MALAAAATKKLLFISALVSALFRHNLFSIWTTFSEPSTARVRCLATNCVQTQTGDVAILDAVKASRHGRGEAQATAREFAESMRIYPDNVIALLYEGRRIPASILR